MPLPTQKQLHPSERVASRNVKGRFMRSSTTFGGAEAAVMNKLAWIAPMVLLERVRLCSRGIAAFRASWGLTFMLRAWWERRFDRHAVRKWLRSADG